MSNNEKLIVPFIATHPGELLLDELKERKIKQSELAKQINQPAPIINDIIKRKRSINADIAVLLEAALDIPASLWLNMQSQYDIDLANQKEKTIQVKKEMKIWEVISEYIPVKIFRKINILTDDRTENISLLKKMFNFNEIEELIENFSRQPSLSSEGLYRKSTKHQIDEVNLFGWKYLAFWLSEQEEITSNFDKDLESYLIQELNKVFLENSNTLERIKSILNSHGIKFIILPKFDKVPVDGFSFWRGDNPTIVLTLRYKYIDRLAFNLMHELAHIFNHLFRDSKDELINSELNERDELEIDANKKACSYLIDDSSWNSFMKTASLISPHAIQIRINHFAKNNNINPAIVLGRYKKETNIFAFRSSINFDIN